MFGQKSSRDYIRIVVQIFANSATIGFLFCTVILVNLQTASAQLVVLDEDFESEDLTANPAWSGDLNHFGFIKEAGNTLLTLQSTPQQSRSQLRTPLDVKYGSWEFYFRQSFSASNVNRGFVFLIADREDLNYLDGSRVNGYAIRTGENGEPKKLRLIRFDNGSQQEILASQTEMEPGKGYQVRVVRNHRNEWTLFVGEGYGSTPRPEATATCEPDEIGSGWFGLLLRYTTRNTDGFKFDNIRITSDPMPLSVESVHPVDRTAIDVRFNRPAAEHSISADAFQFESGIQPVTARLVREREVRLTFDESLKGGKDQLTVTGVYDLNGVETDPGTEMDLLIAFQPKPGDLVINEILFDPLDGTTQENGKTIPSQSEFIEIYNRKEYALSLDGFHLRDQVPIDGNETTMDPVEDGPIWIPGNSFLLLYPERDSERFQDSRLARFFNLPDSIAPFAVRFDRATMSLPRSGRKIVLSDSSGTLLDMVDYRESWHNPNVIDTKGISLERVNPDHTSSDPANWGSSAALSGATPGEENTLFQTPAGSGAEGRLKLTPNPFAPDGDGEKDRIFIHYQLEEPDYLIRVRVFDRFGRFIRTLADGKPAGREGKLIWDGKDNNGRKSRIGIYIIHFEAYNSSTGEKRVFRELAVLATQF